jgi:hypothetical protein
MRARAFAVLVALASLGLAEAGAARATEVKIFQTQSQAGFLAGKLDGVSVDALGRMELAPRAERLASLGEPFLLSAAVHPDGWVVGTGNSGKVFKIDRKGKVTELFAASEPEVFAVWADPDGTVFAGTSPNGKVYRIRFDKAGKPQPAEVWFEPGETYIWALARAADGALLVATGTQGKLFRVTDSGHGAGKGEVLFDSEDTHIRSLAVLPDGDVLMGTSGDGLVLRLSPKGQVRTLYDSAQPEVVGLTVAPDGTCYAAVIASEASLTDVAKDAVKSVAQPGTGGKPPGEPTVTVTMGDEAAAAQASAGRRPSGPRSEILSISPAGVVESLWTFADETVYGLLWQDGSLWVATGLEGKLYRWSDGQMLLAKDVDERQIVAIRPSPPPTPRPSTGSPRGPRRAAPTPAPRSTPGRSPASAPSAGAASRRGATGCASPSAPASAPSRTAPGRRGARRRTVPEALEALSPATTRSRSPLCRWAASCSGAPSSRQKAAGRRGSGAPSCPTGRRT